MAKILTKFTGYERTVLLWGVTVTFGYLNTYFYGSRAIPLWIFLILVNIANYLLLNKAELELDLDLLWVLLSLAAILTLAVPQWRTYVLLTIGIAGFWYTGINLEDASRRIYLGAALLNIFVAAVYLIAPSQIDVYLLMAFVQGMPMLVDYFVE